MLDKIDLGVAHQKSGQQFRKKMCGAGRAGESHGATGFGETLLDGAFGGLGLDQHGLRVALEVPSGFSQRKAARGALNQADAQARFETDDAAAQGRFG